MWISETFADVMFLHNLRKHFRSSRCGITSTELTFVRWTTICLCAIKILRGVSQEFPAETSSNDPAGVFESSKRRKKLADVNGSVRLREPQSSTDWPRRERQRTKYRYSPRQDATAILTKSSWSIMPLWTKFSPLNYAWFPALGRSLTIRVNATFAAPYLIIAARSLVLERRGNFASEKLTWTVSAYYIFD